MNSLIVCEGYQDRAFLSEWLEYLGHPHGMVQVRDRDAQLISAKDAFVKQVKHRQLIIAPAGSYEKLTHWTATMLKTHAEKIDRTLVIADADRQDPRLRVEALQQGLRSRGVTTAFHVELWEPTLEAIIERALRAFDRKAMDSVDAFLSSAPETKNTGKEHAYSWCAAWEPDNFGDAFFGLVWKRPSLRAQLEPLVSNIKPAMVHMLGL